MHRLVLYCTSLLKPHYSCYISSINPHYSCYCYTSVLKPHYSCYTSLLKPNYSCYKLLLKPHYSCYTLLLKPHYSFHNIPSPIQWMKIMLWRWQQFYDYKGNHSIFDGWPNTALWPLRVFKWQIWKLVC